MKRTATAVASMTKMGEHEETKNPVYQDGEKRYKRSHLPTVTPPPPAPLYHRLHRSVRFPESQMVSFQGPGACETALDLKAAWMSAHDVFQAKLRHATCARQLLRAGLPCRDTRKNHHEKHPEQQHPWLAHLDKVFRNFLNSQGNSSFSSSSFSSSLSKSLSSSEQQSPTLPLPRNDDDEDDKLCLVGLEKSTIPIVLYTTTTRRRWLLQKLVHHTDKKMLENEISALSQKASLPARAMAIYLATKLYEQEQKQQSQPFAILSPHLAP